MSLDRALELADASAGVAYPNPTVGAVVVAAGGEVVGEGVTEAAGGRHGEVVALEAAGERARGATLYVTMEPCAHHGRTPPCVDAVAAAGIRAVVAGCRDPNPEAAGGLDALRALGIDTILDDRSRRGRRTRPGAPGRRSGGHSSPTRPRPRSTVASRFPARRWVTGEASRRFVHELRAVSDAVAVGMGTVRADAPRLDARDVEAARQPRRLAFGRGPLPEGSELELRSGSIADELAALAAEGVQSLLLEGGPTLATAFLEANLVDKLLVFVAPTLAGSGPRFIGDLAEPRSLLHASMRPVGDDVLIEAYLREP